MPAEPGTQAPNDVEELHAHECWQLLRGVPVGRLAVAHAGEPDVFPVNHVVDHGTLVFRSAAGTKLDAATGQRVAYEADGVDLSSGRAWSVVCKGRAHLVATFREIVEADAVPLQAWQSGAKPVFVRIVVDSISGRRFRPTWIAPSHGHPAPAVGRADVPELRNPTADPEER